MDRLEDYHLGRIAGKLPARALKMISVVYGMDMEQHELDNIDTEAAGDQQAAMRKILISWRNRTGSKTQLANILHSSQIINDDVIIEKLELEKNFAFLKIPLKEQTTGTKLEQSALGRLAMEIDQSLMRTVINDYLKMPMAQMANITADNRGDNCRAVFEALVRWSNKAENTRQELKKHLKAGGVDPNDIRTILGDD